jgi:hypothetical protein
LKPVHARPVLGLTLALAFSAAPALARDPSDSAVRNLACQAAAQSLSQVGMAPPDRFTLAVTPELRADPDKVFGEAFWWGEAPGEELKDQWDKSPTASLAGCEAVRSAMADRLGPPLDNRASVQAAPATPPVWDASLPVLNRAGDRGVFLVERQDPRGFGSFVGLVLIARTADGWKVIGQRAIVIS